MRIVRLLAVLWWLQVGLASATAQEPAPKLAEKPAENEKPPEKSALPFQIQLLETHIRFGPNGDSRKEVHTVVKLNSIVGAREFARLTFDYNRAFQQVEIPLVRVTHANGGTSELLPSAITDAPNPAVEKFPAYQDVRVKSVRILGLQGGDTVEYRVVTTSSNAPLAPDFWLEHSFDRSGQVLEEIYELELPKLREVQIRTSPEVPTTASQTPTPTDEDHVSRRWHVDPKIWTNSKAVTAKRETEPDIVLTTFSSWGQLDKRLFECIQMSFGTDIWASSMKKVGTSTEPVPERALYDLVSTKIATVDLPLEFTSCPFRDAAEVLSSAYGSPQDKAKLLAVLLTQEKMQKVPKSPGLLFYTKSESPEASLPRPSLLRGILVTVNGGKSTVYLDPSMEVAPYGALRADLRGKKILKGCQKNSASCWATIPKDLPFPSAQKVTVDASIDEDGMLRAKVKYTMRGDNELLLRVAFHQTPKDKWKDVANLLAISDGFRGQVTSVNASDPMATKEPFTVEYELSQPKFVDWSKKPVRIPALLPQIGLPEPPTKLAEDGKASNIALGTPLDVETQLTLHLPPGTKVQTPAGTSVGRDYATYVSKYSVAAQTLTACRQISFLQREIAAERSIDYSAFLHAVQNDQAQPFTLVPAADSGMDPRH